MTLLSKLTGPMKSEERRCIVCWQIFNREAGISCANGHFACAECHKGWINFELDEGRIDLQCPELAGCRALYHPTRIFARLQASDLEKKWQDMSLQECYKGKRVASFLNLRDRQPTAELFFQCPECTYCEVSTVAGLIQSGGIWICTCGAVYCQECQPPRKLAANESEYAEQCVDHPHENHDKKIRYILDETISGAQAMPMCPHCDKLAAKTKESNLVNCPYCSTHFCYVCSTTLPNKSSEARNTFKGEGHHHPTGYCKLKEADEQAYNARACAELKRAFMAQDKFKKEELNQQCDDQLKTIGFTWD